MKKWGKHELGNFYLKRYIELGRKIYKDQIGKIERGKKVENELFQRQLDIKSNQIQMQQLQQDYESKGRIFIFFGLFGGGFALATVAILFILNTKYKFSIR